MNPETIQQCIDALAKADHSNSEEVAAVLENFLYQLLWGTEVET